MTNDVRSLTRRDVLYRLGAVGAAAAVYHGLTTFGLLPVPETRAAVPGYPRDIGKGRKAIGAGVAGVCAAYLLAGHGFETKRGDQLFITLLGSAFIFLAWLGIMGTPLWGALVVSLAYGFVVFRWV